MRKENTMKSKTYKKQKKLIDIFKFNKVLLLNAFKRTIKYKCIHSPWVKVFENYLDNKKEYLSKYEIFNLSVFRDFKLFFIL